LSYNARGSSSTTAATFYPPKMSTNRKEVKEKKLNKIYCL
jgi:hypothetical protein